MKNVSQSSKPLSRLSELSAAHEDLAPYLTREMLLRARTFMNGVNLYRHHPVRRGPEPARIIWQSGTTTLRDYAPEAGNAPPILVVPSLINRFTILDLEPQQSFVRHLAKAGFRPFVVDWDAPSDEEKDFALEAYVMERLAPVLEIITHQAPAHIMGYCMGGPLTLALAALFPSKVRTLTLLAAPWDFQAGYDALGMDGINLEEQLRTFLSNDPYLPVEVVQSLFTAFQPLHPFSKFSSFAGYDQNGPEAARFVLTEDWLNDGVPLTIPAARECFGDWGWRNVLARNEWKIGGKTIDPRQVEAPSYVVIPGKDRIVPPQSSRPLARALPKATCVEPMMGHIGIIASPHAVSQVWEPLVNWLRMQK